MRWQGIAWGMPLAAVAIALLELLRVPLRVHEGEPARVLAAFGQLARDAARELALPALLLLTVAAVMGWTERQTGRPRQVGVAALAGLGLGVSGLVREVLIAHPPFAWSLAANACFVLLGVGLACVFVWLASPRLARHRRASGGAGLLAVASAVVLARGHYALYVGLYPTFHTSALHLAFVLLVAGSALMMAAWPRVRLPRPGALALVASLALLALLELPAAAEARPAVRAYTELGRAAGVARALEREAAFLLPRSLPSPRVDPLLRPDPDAEARFAAHSGLPALPPGFALADHDVLFVLSDTTRFDRTSLARADGPTPNLAALAADAVVFERAYSPSNGTFPSLSAMLAMTPTSFAELDVRSRFWRGRLRDSRITAPEALRASGRATFWVGHDHDRCFSDNILGLEQGFDVRTLIEDAPDADRHIASAAIDAIRGHRAKGQRYFGLVFFGSPHDPYLAHDRDAETDLERYDAELAYMDGALGLVLDALEADGALDSTVVIFAGDHGEAFGEHGHRFHLSSLHTEQIHVPLVVRVGGLERARVRTPTSTAYVLPWLLARGEPPAREAVRAVLRDDLGPLMRALEGAVISEMIGPRRQAVALHWDEYTVLYDVMADVLRIYDAHADPLQLHDLREARPALVEDFAPLVRRYRRIRFAGQRLRFIEAPL